MPHFNKKKRVAENVNFLGNPELLEESSARIMEDCIASLKASDATEPTEVEEVEADLAKKRREKLEQINPRDPVQIEKAKSACELIAKQMNESHKEKHDWKAIVDISTSDRRQGITGYTVRFLGNDGRYMTKDEAIALMKEIAPEAKDELKLRKHIGSNVDSERCYSVRTSTLNENASQKRQAIAR
jgi:hypothetical protein